MNLDMRTVSNKSSSGIFLQCKVHVYKSFSVNSLIFFIQYLFKLFITVFKMPLDSGRFPREHALSKQ